MTVLRPGTPTSRGVDFLSESFREVGSKRQTNLAQLGGSPRDPYVSRDSELPTGRPRVLIVDDDELLGRALGRLVSTQGFTSHITTSSAEALASEGLFEVAVLDLNLGNDSGVELASRLLDEGRVGRVVFHTGTDDPVLLREAMTIGPVVRKGPQATSQLMTLLSRGEGVVE